MKARLCFPWVSSLFFAAALASPAQSNPVKLATTARFDLSADANVGVLTNGYLSVGSGNSDRQTWLDPTNQPGTYTVNFNVNHFAWTPASFKFTPAGSGTVGLTIRGPYEQSPGNGPIYKEEVLFDACSAKNAFLPNGSFETSAAGVPTGWWRTYGVDATVNKGPITPVDGTAYARVWHDGPFSCNLVVTSGLPVTLNFFARAVLPANVPDMAIVPGTNTPAHLAARHFMRGVNMGNYLEVPPGQYWNTTYTTNDFIHIRAQGFDHVRIPGGWNYWVGPGPAYTVSNSYFAREDFMVTNVLNQGLAAIVNIHNWNEFATNALAYTNEFYSIWSQIAAHYAASPPQLAFELINEPNGPGSSTAILNPIYAEAIRRIRLTNPNRTIFVGPSQWQGISELGNLLLPPGDTNLIVSVHCYDPFYFTHQGATWPGPDTATVGVIFPGPPSVPLTPAAGIGSYVTNWIADYNTLPADGNPSSPLAFTAELQFAAQWAAHYGRPVHVGEFGAYTMGDPVSRAHFYAAFRNVADANGLGWAMWDWNAGFQYWNPDTGRPAPGMPAAMFPPPQLATSQAGRISVSAAISKSLRLDRAFSLGPGSAWSPLQTNSLSAPTWLYTDPLLLGTNAAFYRGVWLKP